MKNKKAFFLFHRPTFLGIHSEFAEKLYLRADEIISQRQIVFWCCVIRNLVWPSLAFDPFVFFLGRIEHIFSAEAEPYWGVNTTVAGTGAAAPLPRRR